MTVYLRPGSPYYLIEFWHGDDRIRESSKTEKKAEAKEIERKMKEDLKKRDASGFTSMTLSEAFTRYADTVVKLGQTDGTAFVHEVRRLCDAFGYDTPLDKITTAKVHKWRDDLLTAGKMERGNGGKMKATGGGLKASTINQYLRVLRAVLRKAHFEWKTLAALPLIKDLKKARNKKTILYITHAEEAALVEGSPDHFRPLLQFLLGTGARKTEAFTLVWDNISNLHRGANERSRVFFEHNPDEGRKTKTGTGRFVPITNQLRDLLIAHKANLRKQGYTGPYVFVYGPVNGEWDRLHNPYDAWTTAREFAREKGHKLKGVVLHTMRHTYASRLVMAGEPLINVRDLLGHTDIATTQIYAHLAPQTLDDTIARMEQRTTQLAAV